MNERLAVMDFFKNLNKFSLFSPDCEFLSTEDSWHVPGVSGRIQRADVARYLLKVVEEDLHHKKIVAIAPKTCTRLSYYQI